MDAAGIARPHPRPSPPLEGEGVRPGALGRFLEAHGYSQTIMPISNGWVRSVWLG